MKNLFIYSAFVFLLLSACVKNNPDPSWIEINKWDLIENPNLGTEKSLTHNFSNVYLTIDDNVIGIFELPIKIPVLLEGVHKITLAPVVLNNGISDSKKVYPFCEKYSVSLNLVKNESVVINPVSKYSDGAKFWIEDFEDASLKITDDAVSTSTLLRENFAEILKYGNYYGHVHLNQTASLWKGLTNSGLNLPKSGAEVYLEIDYVNTNTVLTGLIAYDVDGFKDNPNVQLNAQESSTKVWKKMYIELKELVSFSTSAYKFEHYFTAGLDPILTESDVYIDNIKIVYF